MALDPTITPGSYAAENPTPRPNEYQPTADEQALISDTTRKRDTMRQIRQAHEMQWFVNDAMLSGQQFIEYSVRDGRMVNLPVAPAERHAINRIKPKIAARRAKLIKNRVRIFVTPASQEQRDRMDARATQRALDYVWRKDELERKRRQALMKSETQGRGYWWIHFDESRIGQVIDPETQQKVDALLGDVTVEVGGAYEVLVADPSIPLIGDQPEIMRIKMRPVEDMKVRYPENALYIKGDSSGDDMFRYERQIANLSPNGGGIGTEIGKRKVEDWVLVTEHFIRPCGKYPKGHYRVVVGNVLVKMQDELPYGFWDLANPYPVEEFIDVAQASRYWGTTLVEQLSPLQREYNLGRSKLVEHIKKSVHPKIVVFKQHRLPDGAWHNKAGEIIELYHTPGLPPPIVVNPPNIAGDLWRVLEMVRVEFDDLSQVYPAAEGKSGGATSGFQTNLLQEATDLVHRPDIEALDATVERAMFKIRRVMKLHYDIPRLLSIVGRNMEPEVVEFVNSQIDEAADLKVESGSALPDLRAQRMQMVKEMYDASMFGQVGSPDAIRKSLSLMELGGVDDAIDTAKIDENLARIENNEFSNNVDVANPEFFHNHQIHYEVHTELLKSPEVRTWQPEQKQKMMLHLIGHLDFFDPAAALSAATQYGLPPPPNALMLQQQQMMQQQMGMAQPAPTPDGSQQTGVNNGTNPIG